MLLVEPSRAPCFALFSLQKPHRPHHANIAKKGFRFFRVCRKAWTVLLFQFQPIFLLFSDLSFYHSVLIVFFIPKTENIFWTQRCYVVLCFFVLCCVVLCCVACCCVALCFVVLCIVIAIVTAIVIAIAVAIVVIIILVIVIIRETRQLS